MARTTKQRDTPKAEDRRGPRRRSAGEEPRASAGDEPQAEEGRAPDAPHELGTGGWTGALKRTVSEFRQDNLTDWAAALTYYGILALFPGLLVLVAILGLAGAGAIQPLIDNLATVAPGPAKDIIVGALTGLQENQGTAGVMALVGVVLALWSASGYVGAFMRASNSIYEVGEGRPFWKKRPLQMGITLLMVLLLAACAVAVVVSGPLAQRAGDLVGAGDTAVTIWNFAKWPVILLVFMTMLALLYYAAPNVRHPRFQWVSPGSVAGVLIWLVASAAFALYVANFPNNETYGAMGGVIVFLTWLWISNIAVLLGAELNAEVERGRQIEAGQPPDREPFLEPRDTRAM